MIIDVTPVDQSTPIGIVPLGPRGFTGWTPVLAIVEDDSVEPSRHVHQVVDWIGVGPSKPDTGLYVGVSGLVEDIEDAINLSPSDYYTQGQIDAALALKADDADLATVAKSGSYNDLLNQPDLQPVATSGDYDDLTNKPVIDIAGLEAKTDAVTYDTLTALAESAGDNEKAALKRLFEPGGTIASRSVVEAAPLFVPSTIQRLAIGRYSYVRRSGEPTHDLKLRTADRYTDEGDHDSANGGYWGIDAPLISIDAAGGQKGADNSTAKAKAIIAAGDDAIIAYGSGWGVGTAQPYWGSSYTDAAGLQIIQGQLASPVGDARAPLLWLEQYDSADADTYRKPGALYVHYAKTSGKKPSEGATFVAEHRFDPVTAGLDHQGLYVIASHHRVRLMADNTRGTAVWAMVHVLPGITPQYCHGMEINAANFGGDFGYAGAYTNGKVSLLNLSITDAGAFPVSDYLVIQSPNGMGGYRGIWIRQNAIAGRSADVKGDGEALSIEGGANGSNRYGALRLRGFLRYAVRMDEADLTAALWMKKQSTQGIYWGDITDDADRSFIRQEVGGQISIRSRLGNLNVAVGGTTTNFTLTTDGRLGIGTSAPSTLLDINSQTLRLRSAKTPSSASDNGSTGEVCWDAGYVYVCIASNTWKRAPLATW